MSKNQKNRWKLMKIANIEREIFHTFLTTWGNSMKFSGKMWFTKNQGFPFSLEHKLFKKPQGGRESEIDLSLSHFRVKSITSTKFIDNETVLLHKKWSFPLRISSINVTQSAVSCGFGHIYWRNPQWKISFFVQ